MNLKTIIGVIFACSLIFTACNKAEEVRVIPVNDFFKTQDKFSYRISPDGKHVSYVKAGTSESVLVVEDIDGGGAKEITSSGGVGNFFYSWVSNDELIYYKEGKVGERYKNLFIKTTQLFFLRRLRRVQMNANSPITKRVELKY